MVADDLAWKARVQKELNSQTLAAGAASTARSPRFASTPKHRGVPNLLQGPAGEAVGGAGGAPASPSCTKSGIDGGFWKARVQKELNRQQACDAQTASEPGTPCSSPGGPPMPNSPQSPRLAGTPLSSRFTGHRRPTLMGEVLRNPRSAMVQSTPPQRPETAPGSMSREKVDRCEVGQWLGKSPIPKFVDPR